MGLQSKRELASDLQRLRSLPLRGLFHLCASAPVHRTSDRRYARSTIYGARSAIAWSSPRVAARHQGGALATSNADASLRYRPDIDGLRALSIIAVVLHHFKVPYFGGGFVGVDVFFVISGFLITGIVQAEIRKGDFSFARFYERRARRLLPTLAIVLSTTFVLAFVVMTPQDIEALSRSMFYALLFAANFFFAEQGGYFSTSLENAPLLHTWSLAVEEQFYIVWPILLLLIARMRPRSIVPITLLLLALSFVAAVALGDSQGSGAFFYPHTRAWELLAGCVLALHSAGAPRSCRARELAGTSTDPVCGFQLRRPHDISRRGDRGSCAWRGVAHLVRRGRRDAREQSAGMAPSRIRRPCVIRLVSVALAASCPLPLRRRSRSRACRDDRAHRADVRARHCVLALSRATGAQWRVVEGRGRFAIGSAFAAVATPDGDIRVGIPDPWLHRALSRRTAGAVA